MKQAGLRTYETRTVFDALWDWLQHRLYRKPRRRVAHLEARQELQRTGLSRYVAP